MNWVSFIFGLVVGKMYGQYVLGLKDSYPEYFDDSLKKK